MRTGFYSRSNGNTVARIKNSYWWSSTSYSDTYGRYLYVDPLNNYPQTKDFRGYGFAIRCTIRVE